jgi:hypothetical protein
MLLSAAIAPAMVRNYYQDGLVTAAWAAVAAGRLGVQPQTFGRGSPEA